MKIYLDIETVADNRLPQPLMEQLMEVQQDGRLKDPLKIADDLASKRIKVISEMGLSPLTGKVVCFAMTCDPNSGSQKYDRGHVSVDEHEVLVSLDEAIMETGANYALDQLITFNGKEFDVPFIRTRMALHHIGSSTRKLNEWVRKYDQDSHLDLRQYFGGFGAFQKGTLEQWALLFGVLSEPSGETGADVQAFYDNNELDRIYQKCRRDVQTMVGLCDRAML